MSTSPATLWSTPTTSSSNGARRTSSRLRSRARTSSITPPSASTEVKSVPLDQRSYEPTHNEAEEEPEVSIVLASPQSKGQRASVQPGNKISLQPASIKGKQLSRVPSQISVIEVEASPPSPHIITKSSDTSVASWRHRSFANETARTSGEEKQDALSSPSYPFTRAARPPGESDPAQPGHRSASKTVGPQEPRPTMTQRRVSIPVPLASFPRASVPSLPYSSLPDLNKIEAIRPALVAEQLMLSEPCQLPETKTFTLSPPMYTDTEIPPPESYNDAFPHPLTSYASPGVNANTVLLSGYDIELAKLMKTDRAKALGSILATCDRPGITAPTIAKHLRSYIPDGNGIPGFDNEGAAKAALGPVGAAICRSDDRLNELTGGGGSGIQPVFTPALGNVPPRLAAQARAESRNREAHLSMSSMSDHGYRPITPPLSPQYLPRTAVKVHGTDDYLGGFAYRRASVASDIQQHQLAPTHHYSPYPSDPFRSESYALVHPGPDSHLKSSPSPSTFHKTELCPAWQEQGQCKYGSACQFAHGLAELRLPLARTPFAFPEMPSPRHRQSPVAATGLYKTELRRASAPYSPLDTVHEAEDDYPFPIFTPGRRASEAVGVGELSPASLAFRKSSIARLSIPRQVDSGRQDGYPYSSDVTAATLAAPRTPTQTALSGSFSSAALATPSDRVSPGGYLHSRTSDSSMGSHYHHSPSPKAPYLRSDESTPTRAEPINTPSMRRSGNAQPPSPADAASAGSWDSRSGSGSGSGSGSNHKASSNSTSATVDFSAGRSIWC